MITITEITEYYKEFDPRLSSFKIDQFAEVKGVDKFLKGHINTLLAHPGNKEWFLGYWERLESFYLEDRYGKNQ